MRFVYTILFYLALPFLFLRLLWRSRRTPDYRRRWGERLGFCPFKLDHCIWVHAVSVGETIAAVPLIKALMKAFPESPIVVTNMTPTGAARVKAALNDRVRQVYIPYDVPDAVNRFLQRIRPRVAVMMEGELWPNLFASCRKYQIPIVIANACLSEKSARGYAIFGSVTREMFKAIHHVAAAALIDQVGFLSLGLPREKITITGNLKFDLELPINLPEKSELLRQQLKVGGERLIWIAASTHEGEEEIILAAHQLVLQKNPSALLILVPRHPNRFDAIAEMIKQQKFNSVRRSQNGVCTPQTTVYLGDTMGELLLLYSVADVAFVGGSFVPIGGHNMLEPAVLHKPVVTGPLLFGFLEISQLLLDAQGMVIAENAEELAILIERFFAETNYRLMTGENAYKVVEANRGALEKQLDVIRQSIS
ncbi:MAG: waaA [Gammaproteobacteria bacterium]|jgi:3-deoxy-D-manno-octulosonic-acid transferase|nr:waaA [Gammaproteobacteria bacterium]